MNAPLLLRAALLRALVLAGVTVAYMAAVSRSETTDALGVGLLAFLILVVISFVWSLADGIRRGFRNTVVLWLFASVLGGVAVPLSLALTDTADFGVGEALSTGAIFFAVLLFIPALLGLGLGSLGHRMRADRPDVANSPA